MQLSLDGAGDLEAVFSQKITSIVGILDCICRFLKKILASFFFFPLFFLLMELLLCVKKMKLKHIQGGFRTILLSQ